jgi:hypothetical protein
MILSAAKIGAAVTTGIAEPIITTDARAAKQRLKLFFFMINLSSHFYFSITDF